MPTNGYVLILTLDFGADGCGGARTRAGQNRGASTVDSMDGGKTSPESGFRAPNLTGKHRKIEQGKANSPKRFSWMETA